MSRKFLVTHKPTGERKEIDSLTALSEHIGVPEAELPSVRMFKCTYGDFCVFEYLKRSDGSYVR